MTIQDQTTVLLNLIEGPMNLGAIARAMANTGFSKLRFHSELTGTEGDARKFALHALPIIEKAAQPENLEGLLEGIDCVFAFTPRDPWPDGKALSLDGFLSKTEELLAENKTVGLLFGNEARGLENEHLTHCHYRVALPTDPGYESVNLSQAVLLALWELMRHHKGKLSEKRAPDPERASADEKAHLVNNMRLFLESIEFLNPQNPDHIFGEVRHLIKSRDWTTRELELLHAIFGKGRSRYESALRKLEG